MTVITVTWLCCGCSLSALHEAAIGGHLELTQLLIEHGAAVDVHDNEGLDVCFFGFLGSITYMHNIDAPYCERCHTFILCYMYF